MSSESGKRAGLAAARVLRCPTTSKEVRAVAMAALSSTRRTVHPDVIIETAKRILRNPKSTVEEKSMAASLLVNKRRKRVEWLNP